MISPCLQSGRRGALGESSATCARRLCDHDEIERSARRRSLEVCPGLPQEVPEIDETTGSGSAHQAEPDQGGSMNASLRSLLCLEKAWRGLLVSFSNEISCVINLVTFKR